MRGRFLVSGNVTPARRRVADFIREYGFVITPHSHFICLQIRDGTVIWNHHVSWSKLVRISCLDKWLRDLEEQATIEIRRVQNALPGRSPKGL